MKLCVKHRENVGIDNDKMWNGGGESKGGTASKKGSLNTDRQRQMDHLFIVFDEASIFWESHTSFNFFMGKLVLW